MIEIIRAIWETTVSGEQAVSLSAWCLTIVTALDAKVGVRIYTRATILINLLSGKIAKKAAEPETSPLIMVRTAKAQNAAHDRYIRA